MPYPVPVVDWVLVQGETLEKDFQIMDPDSPLNPLNITGWSARSHGRVAYGDASPHVVFTTTITDGANGMVRISLTASETAAVTADAMKWDIEVQSPAGRVVRAVKGDITLDKEATK